MIGEIIKRILPKHVVYDIELPFREMLQSGRLSFSHEGEDIILDRYFQGRDTGFYVDIGSHHPIRFSNTHFFYLRGWRGINVDALPGSKDLFDEFRPGDINLEAAVSDVEEVAKYYMFSEPALNTFCKTEAEYKASLESCDLIGSVDLSTLRLAKILDQYVGDNIIDFMSVDVEGLEMNVLRSNNWDRYRPQMVLVELLRHSFDEVLSSRLNAFLKSRDYEIVAKTQSTLFFRAR